MTDSTPPSLEERIAALENEVLKLKISSFPPMSSISCTPPYYNPYDVAQPLPYQCQYSDSWRRAYGYLCPAHFEHKKKLDHLKSQLK